MPKKKLSRRNSTLLVKMPCAVRRLTNVTTASKMGAHWWRAKHISVDHPQAKIINKVRTLIKEDRYVTIQELSNEVGISVGSEGKRLRNVKYLGEGNSNVFNPSDQC